MNINSVINYHIGVGGTRFAFGLPVRFVQEDIPCQPAWSFDPGAGRGESVVSMLKPEEECDDVN